MKEQLNTNALAATTAILSAAGMFILGIFGNLGWHMGAVSMMQDMHLMFSPSILGIVLGMIEAAIIGYLIGYVFAWTYNKLQ